MADIEFLIHEVRVEDGAILVSGIVNKGSVSVGSDFFLLRYPSSGAQSVRLSVKKVVAYRREIPELPMGMSGELTLDGQGGGLLAKPGMLEA